MTHGTTPDSSDGQLHFLNAAYGNNQLRNKSHSQQPCAAVGVVIPLWLSHQLQEPQPSCKRPDSSGKRLGPLWAHSTRCKHRNTP